MSSAASTLLALGEEGAAARPDEPAYTFLHPKAADRVVTYASLFALAQGIAARLQEEGAEGQRVLLLATDPRDFVPAFFGCVLAGALAVPVNVPSPRPERRQGVVGIAADCGATLVLVASEEDAQSTREWLVVPGAPPVRVLPISLLLAKNERAAQSHWRRPSITKESPAFLQYTSGSTSAPKGVMVSHHNILCNTRMIAEVFGMGPQDIWMSWLPLFHDMGLVGGMLTPFVAGVPGILMPTTSFVAEPVRWLQAMSHFRATISGAPNFAYDTVARRATPAKLAGLDLSSWRVAFNGAEPVRTSTMKRFTAALSPLGFRHSVHFPCYGMAEATVLISGGDTEREPTSWRASAGEISEGRVVLTQEGDRELVSVGRTGSDHHVVIVDPETLLVLPPGQIGEIWVKGDSVACGYWGKPELSAETFQATTRDGDGPYLRTGDLGGFVGQDLVIAGRLKDLIIVNGRNLYPQEIELSASGASAAFGLCRNVAFGIEGASTERIVLVQEVQRSHVAQGNGAELRRAAAEAVMRDHGLALFQVVIARPSSLPLTTSGKVRRSETKRRFQRGELLDAFPSNP